jgi:hypothetical protein
MLAVRESAAALLGRDSESLSERNFVRILQDAHDADVIDLRKRGDSWEVAPVQQVAEVAEQLAKHEAAHAPKPVAGPPAPRGMGSRGGRGGRLGAPPPELLMVGVVDDSAPIVAPVTPEPAPAPAPVVEAPAAAAPVAKSGGRNGNSGRPAAKKSAPPAKKAPAKTVPPAAKKAPAKKVVAKAPAKSAAKKSAKR